jgi:hypothetical protein
LDGSGRIGEGFELGRRAGGEGRLTGRRDGLKPLQLFEGAVVRALGGINAALDASESVEGVEEGIAEGTFFAEAVPALGVQEFGFPELSLDFTEAAEQPFRLNKGIDEEGLLGRGGAKAVVIVEREVFEDGGIFAANHGRLSVDAGFEGVEAGGGLALDRAGTGGFHRVSAIGGDLSGCGHEGQTPVRG